MTKEGSLLDLTVEYITNARTAITLSMNSFSRSAPSVRFMRENGPVSLHDGLNQSVLLTQNGAHGRMAEMETAILATMLSGMGLLILATLFIVVPVAVYVETSKGKIFQTFVDIPTEVLKLVKRELEGSFNTALPEGRHRRALTETHATATNTVSRQRRKFKKSVWTFAALLLKLISPLLIAVVYWTSMTVWSYSVGRAEYGAVVDVTFSSQRESLLYIVTDATREAYVLDGDAPEVEDRINSARGQVQWLQAVHQILIHGSEEMQASASLLTSQKQVSVWGYRLCDFPLNLSFSTESFDVARRMLLLERFCYTRVPFLLQWASHIRTSCRTGRDGLPRSKSFARTTGWKCRRS